MDYKYPISVIAMTSWLADFLWRLRDSPIIAINHFQYYVLLSPSGQGCGSPSLVDWINRLLMTHHQNGADVVQLGNILVDSEDLLD
jgi:hypothetical protein